VNALCRQRKWPGNICDVFWTSPSAACQAPHLTSPHL
jgi:hypothetical protein